MTDTTSDAMLALADKIQKHVDDRGGPAKDEDGRFVGTVWPMMLEAAEVLRAAARPAGGDREAIAASTSMVEREGLASAITIKIRPIGGDGEYWRIRGIISEELAEVVTCEMCNGAGVNHHHQTWPGAIQCSYCQGTGKETASPAPSGHDPATIEAACEEIQRIRSIAACTFDDPKCNGQRGVDRTDAFYDAIVAVRALITRPAGAGEDAMVDVADLIARYRAIPTKEAQFIALCVSRFADAGAGEVVGRQPDETGDEYESRARIASFTQEQRAMMMPPAPSGLDPATIEACAEKAREVAVLMLNQLATPPNIRGAGPDDSHYRYGHKIADSIEQSIAALAVPKPIGEACPMELTRGNYSSERHEWFDLNGKENVAVIQDLSDVYALWRVAIHLDGPYRGAFQSPGGVRDFQTRDDAAAYLSSVLEWSMRLGPNSCGQHRPIYP